MIELRLEEQIVYLCAKLNLSDGEYDKLKVMLLNKPNWGEIFRISVFNKTMGLTAKHLLHYNTNVIPGVIRRQLLFLSLGNRERNKALFQELSKLLQLFNESGISYSPLKGAYLIPYVYKDFSVRLSNDIDILIGYEDIELAERIISSAGFVKGEYDDVAREVIPPDRKRDIYWKTQMGNIYPYVKLSENNFLDFIVVDFAFDVDPVHKNRYIAEEMLKNCEITKIGNSETKILKPVDFLIQICTHLYKEACARNVLDNTYSDINFIKFCDVREMFLLLQQKGDKKIITELVEHAKKYNVEGEIRYCIECCRMIYKDRFWDDLIDIFSKFDINENNAINYMEDSFWNILFRRI